ncbi:MAG: alpha/beta fold hydrolase [Candidatus Nanopelagicales bacterium]|jgi:pimeloyl-ACP methyl ester carboxylesterase
MAVPPAVPWDLGDRTLSVRRLPAPGRPTLVMVHGLGGSSLNWVALMRELEGEFDLVALDLPGFGASPPPRDGRYSPAGHGRAVVALINALQDDAFDRSAPVHLMGNSLGGAVSVQVAGRRPDLVASLSLISPAMPHGRVGRGNVHLPVVAIPGIGDALVKRYAQVPAEVRMQSTVDACFAEPGRLDDDVRAALLDEVRGRDELTYSHDAFLSSLRGLMGSFFDAGPRRPWRLAQQYPGPVLAVYGEADILVDARAATRAARQFADPEVVLIPDCGHVAQMEHPALVAELFCSRVSLAKTGI